MLEQVFSCPIKKKIWQKRFYNLIIMLLRARDNNIQSFAFIWLDKGNQNEFLKHPKIKSF